MCHTSCSSGCQPACCVLPGVLLCASSCQAISCVPVCVRPVCCTPVCCRPVCCRPVCCTPVCCTPVCCEASPYSASSCCQPSSLGCCCGTGSVPGLGTST
uniref:Uncharacterized protein n=1 Tax=Sus scrofa TaxID=9823 RepID=A0A8D1FG19_PIG